VPKPGGYCIETVQFIVPVTKWTIDFQAAGTLALNKRSYEVNQANHFATPENSLSCFVIM
jgi:hypothetical protein